MGHARQPGMQSSPAASLRLDEAALRDVLLAQGIEQLDTQHALVSAAEREALLADALRQAAPSPDASPARLEDVLRPWAEGMLRHAVAREPALAALREGLRRWRWAAWAAPLAALLAGLAADRIANAHRVDLLSPPLLLVLAWNLAVYGLLAWKGLRRRMGTPQAGLPGGPPRPVRWLHGWLQRGFRPGRRRGRGLLARIGADFHLRWLEHTGALQGARIDRVLHLCAAAGAAGLALSLLLRGLVVRYQFGWESTFLDAAQVHAIARVLFWPLTALTGLAPFSLEEIAAAQDFAGQGAAGNRWVWMYVGLLVLVVVLPRLLLAAAARWREVRLSRRCLLDLQAPAFDALRAALPARIVLGVAGIDEAQVRALVHLQELHAGDAGPVRDRLHFVVAQDAATAAGVDAVLFAWRNVPATRLPQPWQQAPRLHLRWTDWGASWPREAQLFVRLRTLLPERAAALARLQTAWEGDNRRRFAAATLLLAQHLRGCAALVRDGRAADALAREWRALDTALRALHRLPAQEPTADAVAAGGPPRHDTADGAAPGPDMLSVVGTSAGAAAGAAAGAKAGALVDLGLGGLTLGAGTAVGALLGGVGAWALRARQRRGSLQETRRALVEAACLHYLALAHQARLPQGVDPMLAARWQALVSDAIAARWPVLLDALDGAAPAPDPLQAHLTECLEALLSKLPLEAPGKPGGTAPYSPSTT